MSDSDFIPFEPSYTVTEFCKAERISRVALYDFWKQGKGPRYYMKMGDAGASLTKHALPGSASVKRRLWGCPVEAA